MKNILYIGLLFFNYSSVAGITNNLSAADLKLMNCVSDTSRYAVLADADISRIFNYDCKPAKLSCADLISIDSLLRNVINRHNLFFSDNEEMQVQPFENYRFQLISVVNPSGEKLVWVNAICEEIPEWRKKLVYVSDGGNCYFKTRINLHSKTCQVLMINGLAYWFGLPAYICHSFLDYDSRTFQQAYCRIG